MTATPLDASYSRLRRAIGMVLAFAPVGCSPVSEQPVRPPSILLITLDTVRADAVGFAGGRARTPNLDELAERGVVFEHAYTTAPMTLPAHVSMLTGQYPADHGLRENGRFVDQQKMKLAATLGEKGYRTAAFVSGFPLAARFGLAHGFDHFDDDFGDAAERRADATTERVLAYLERSLSHQLFVWVHYYDAHEPYDPPEPFRSEASSLYEGEIAFVDDQVGRLVKAFESHERDRPVRMIVVGDHGEGLGDHGETFHGNLLYDGVMRVPLVVAGSGVTAGRRPEPVSSRRVFETILGFAGLRAERSLMSATTEVVLAEAMKPYLQYGWQPQVMAAEGDMKVIESGGLEVFDLATDPEESRDLTTRVGDVTSQQVEELRAVIRGYLESGLASGGSIPLDENERRRLASLGYLTPTEPELEPRPLRSEAPSPRTMIELFEDLDRGSGLFLNERYQEAIPVFGRVLARDPSNFTACLRLAVAHSVLGHGAESVAFFEQAREIDPGSVDLDHYLAQHHSRSGRDELATPLLEGVIAAMPNRVSALQTLARIRMREGLLEEAVELYERAVLLDATATPLVELGDAAMALGRTTRAIEVYEEAKEVFSSDGFPRALELGVCYLADGRFEDARANLDTVSASHPSYSMALFKRAQVAVLLGETDRAERVRHAYRSGDETTKPLIEQESLFRGIEIR